jgi:beta-lactamase superfamily II metal-dependent hydrolase
MSASKRRGAEPVRAGKTTGRRAAKRAAPKRAAAKHAAGKPAASHKFSNKRITVRMYNVGFGDAFLLVFPAKDRPRKVLIDCGVHVAGANSQAPLARLVEQIIADVTEGDTPRIDLVIATHRHQDHVKGFANPLWKTVEVGEVWMPWTEDYKDPRARKILEAQSTKAEKLARVLGLLLAQPARFGFRAEKVAELRMLQAFSANSLSNPAAMATLHDGFKGGKAIPRRYLPFKERNDNSFEPSALPGVIVHVMGPSRNEETIRDLNPPSNEQWLRLMESKLSPDFEAHRPFAEGWASDFDDLKSDDALRTLLNKNELKRIESIGEGTELGVAVQLEQAVNGTSLMIMFQMGKARLLFPGDAQNGTWKMALADPEWRALLTQTSFYKVGHHGSHNATPKEFVFDLLPRGFKAMTSVRGIPKFKFIPKTELMEALKHKKGKIARSDKPEDDPTGFTRDGLNLYVETLISI